MTGYRLSMMINSENGHSKDSTMPGGGRLDLLVKFCFCLLSMLLLPLPVLADEFDDLEKHSDFLIDDRPAPDQVVIPAWFKNSFLDLKEDLEEARQAKKVGIAVYFGQKDCAYCKAMMEVNLKTPDIRKYMRKHFDVIPLDIWNSREVTDVDGVTMTEREYSVREQTNFTPSFIFYDSDGDVALRLRGYYPPYSFRAALKYVVEGYYKEETLQAYMRRADPPGKFELEEMNTQTFFDRPPYALDRSHFKAQKPLLVFFEQKSCHACDILHTEPLGKGEVLALIDQFEVVQLDVEADTPVLTPSGENLTAKKWSEQMNIFYTPALVFFDLAGKEIIRLDSVAGQHRLQGVMRYVLSGAYKKHPTYIEYRFGRKDAY